MRVRVGADGAADANLIACGATVLVARGSEFVGDGVEHTALFDLRR